MGVIMNGISYGGIFTPSGATFLVFADYMRATMRIAALAELPVSYILTHDSIGVGEDGPTHQPVETVSGLRVFPNMDVMRPADYEETAAAYAYSITKGMACGTVQTTGPVSLILTRQNVKYLTGVSPQAGVSGLWYKYVGLQGKVVGVDRFGFSAPGDITFRELGMTTENLIAECQ